MKKLWFTEWLLPAIFCNNIALIINIIPQIIRFISPFKSIMSIRYKKPMKKNEAIKAPIPINALKYKGNSFSSC